MAEPPSSPPSEATGAEDALSWYKSQYEMLESELAEFRESSRELEKELEKDIERAEKQERVFQEKAEALGFEVEEWKRKYKESKTEASAAQNTLEKEITTLRDSNRSLQLKLRDIEVANDDFERQARNTTSSLEDMESKFNQVIERAVMMEEEIKSGEQEREQLRIESQRLREELADLKIEADLMQDKIKKHEARHLSAISTDMSLLGSPTFDKNADGSPNSAASSPLVTTPPDTKSLSTADTISEVHDPPSPPMSDASAPVPKSGSAAKTPARAPARKSRLPSLDGNATPKPRSAMGTAARPPGGRMSGVGASLRTPANRSSRTRPAGHKIPASNSLTHIRTLTAQMQRLEARVHSARSKLPGPTIKSPRASPRSASKGPTVPSTVTIRSRKRTLGSSTSSMAGDETTPTNATNPRVAKSHVPRLSTSGTGRLSFGPLPNRGPESDMSRPSSRASLSSYARPSSRNDMVPPPRPMSRTSMSGTRTPLGRSRSSMSGSLHSLSASIGRMDEEEDDGGCRTPSRRGTYSKLEMDAEASGVPIPGSTIPTPSNRRQSEGRRTSSGVPVSSLRRPSTSAARKLSDLGETY
ncbi:hypothetical protein HRG_004150 [Hirsutella rhossiliensis]|uniref:NUDE domain-containing protein n=1 Tax=Hirsutella rhossiliensis TaxID=111463 RepID=A0A9P8N5I3_9HYPO|nr:uncharacterized protein HRG_04150 [Hirsutella rhossiliensis]KAH0966134.1 hypothetical protein HRG_04150 [Hirsutella rhossiliensis]